MPTIRPFTLADTEACVALFAGNEGRYFDPGERALFEAFLANPRLTADFFVRVAEGGRVVACGGFLPAAPGVVELTWGMVDRAAHGQGHGRALLLDRLARIRERHGPATVVRVETSQHTAGFFARHGFLTLEVRPDGYGPGIDYVKMERPAAED